MSENKKNKENKQLSKTQTTMNICKNMLEQKNMEQFVTKY